MRVTAAEPERLERALEEMKAAGKDASPVDAEDIREMVEQDQFELKIDPRLSLVQMVQMMPEITDRYVNMKWTVARTTPNLPYFTSDNPVVRMNPKHTGSFYDSHGIANINVEIRFPLDKLNSLVMMHDIKRIEEWNELRESGRDEEARILSESVPVTVFIKAPPQLVEAINVGTARFAKRFVFSHAKSSGILTMMGKEPGGLWPTMDA
jgi:hypothetical protein